ncbi:MAG: AAA family ATPase [Gammaproteobacteria bacterium]
MLLSYSFSNFQSFRERVEVDLTLSRKTPVTDWMMEASTGPLVSKLMAVIGPNGSGKTALLKPVAFVSWFVAASFQSELEAPIPFAPHFAAPNKPSTFELNFEFDGKLWRYELTCIPQRVLHEALYQKRERYGYVFVRDWDKVSQSYIVKQKDFGLSPQEAKKVRQNVSLVSTAAQYGEPLAQKLIAAFAVNTNVNLLGRRSLDDYEVQHAAEHFSKRPTQTKKMSSLLASWDLGLTGVELKEIGSPTPENSARTIWVPFGKHVSGDNKASLPFIWESSGTQGAFVLLSHLLPVLEAGGLAVIDEFENDLHPYMLEPILDLFSNRKTNPHNAQLLFTCHAVEVLNLLNKAQVMLVEKDKDCESSACRLDAVQGIRSDDNYYGKYMAGAYGAVPQL